METFILGFITAVISFIMAYSYLTISQKRVFNRLFANPITDMIVTMSVMVLSVGTNGSLFMAIGIGFGLSLSLRVGKIMYGIGR